MAQYSNDEEKLNFADDIRTIRILSFKSDRKSLLYAGSIPTLFDNWKLAADFAHAHGMVPIQATEGGQYLSIPDRLIDLQYTRDQYKKIWNRASVKYCLNIEGSVKTFVCGANDGSTFRRKEIHAMLRSTTIDEINGRSHKDYVHLRRAILNRLNEEGTLPQGQRHRRAITNVFRAIAIAEIRQDLTTVREQNNEQEAESVLARVFHLKAQHREERTRMPRSSEIEKLAESFSTQEEMTHANPNLHLILYPHHAHR